MVVGTMSDMMKSDWGIQINAKASLFAILFAGS